MGIAILLLLVLGAAHVASFAMVVVGMLRSAGRPPAAPAPAVWPSVSVVLPAHDEEERLPATLASLAAQRYDGPHEFLIVDDRSSDATPAIVEGFVRRDPRFRLLRVTTPSRRHAPKVNAVRRGIQAGRGDVIVTTDADCTYDPRWLEACVRALEPGVAMVSGYVEAAPTGRGRFVDRFEAADWFSLMLTSRSLLRFGHAFASSANNQAYRRSAFHAAGGFGVAARAPSGDEDLLAQRLGRLSGGRVVFGETPELRVTTRTMGSWRAFLRQRRRWVSRYHHVVQYDPAFFAGLAVLAGASVGLSASLLASPFAPRLAPFAWGLYAAHTLVAAGGMMLGARQLGRPQFAGWLAVVWALLHPFFIAYIVLASFVRPASWRAPTPRAPRYRRRVVRYRLRLLRRRLLERAGVADG